jgi:hypothetical protein
MLLNRQELDEVNFPGRSAAQCRLVLVLYDAFCLGTVIIDPLAARFAATPVVFFYLERLVMTSRSCNRLYTDNTNLGGAFPTSIRSSYLSLELFSPFLADNEWKLKVEILSQI